MDLIERIHKKSGAIVSFSFSSTDPEVTSVFEPGVPAPADRLNTIKMFRSRGIPCGAYLLPVLPFISDTISRLKRSISDFKKAGIDFVGFGGLTLKEGRQKEYYYDRIRNSYPHLISEYDRIYTGKKWGEATREHSQQIHKHFYHIVKEHGIPVRIPEYLYRNLLNQNDLVIVILEHLEYMLRLQGDSSNYGYAAHSISLLNEPLSEMKKSLDSLPGVGTFTRQIIEEIIETGNSTYYSKISENYRIQNKNGQENGKEMV
jgi:hypothetical protein